MKIMKKEVLKEVEYDETAGFDKYYCPCGYEYDELKGDPDSGIEPGTKWEDIPDDWVCPVCGLAKSDFEKIEVVES